MVNAGGTTTLTVTPNSGYAISGVTGCAGSLTGSTYTTGAINANCSVTASFIAQYAATAAPGAGGTMSPSSSTVNAGSTTTFTVTPNGGYAISSVSGCGGTLSGNTYTTGAINTSCTVTASFAAAFTWVGGSATGADATGSYGTQGVAAAANYPGAHSGAVKWQDASGDIWFFGGYGGYDSAGRGNVSNQLWKYSPANGEWTWVSGSSVSGALGNYGTLGVAASANVPGARQFAVGWMDGGGNLWLHGGEGLDSTGGNGWLNDLWEYSPTTGLWSWMGGSNVINQAGVYGTQGVASTSNVPGGRSSAVSWTDAHGNFWLFGGEAFDANGMLTNPMGDLWEYSPSSREWTWVGGPNTYGESAGVYGTQGVAAATNIPGGRAGGASWTDANGNLWMFGGLGFGASTYSAGWLNDLWEFSPTTGMWTWVSGSTDYDAVGSYGTEGVAAPSNAPPGRAGSAIWADPSGDLWLFGGQGGTNGSSWMNDLWKYSASSGQWTWIAGSSAVNASGVYGTQGVAAVSNIPGARAGAVNWSDASGNLWLFGGSGKDSTGASFTLNDLWKYPTQ
jgi:hypothetical protein